MVDTIAAIATPPGAGGIGIVRVSGPLALAILQRLFQPVAPKFISFRPWMLHRGRVRDVTGLPLDDALAVFMPGPRSFTGEDVAEFHCHGGPALLGLVLEQILASGAKPAERGEFTRRAFLNGRLDLSQAEAVAEMIAAPSRQGVHLALNKLEGVLGRRVAELRTRLETLRANVCLAVDFPEEEVECLAPETFLIELAGVERGIDDLLAGFERARCWQGGVRVALAGPVNSGKSSLLNALLGHERAIVTERPGTTRDFLEENVNLAGLAVRLVDTAGLRELTPDGDAADTSDPVETVGIRMGRERIDAADAVLLLVDGAVGVTAEIRALAQELDPDRVILIWNKVDSYAPPVFDFGGDCHCAAQLAISARTGEGLEDLARLVREVVLRRMDGQEPELDESAPNLRQARSLQCGLEELRALRCDIQSGVPYDLCAVRLETVGATLGEVIGLDAPAEVLNRIFESFCIGK